MARVPACCEGDGDLANLGRFSVLDGLAARQAVLEDKADCVFRHRQGLGFIFAVGDDLWQGGNPDGKPTLLLRLEDDCEAACPFHGDPSFMCARPKC